MVSSSSSRSSILVGLTFFFLLGFVSFSRSQIIQNTFTTVQSGYGTYYGQSTSGNCGFGSDFPSWVGYTKGLILPVALNTPQYDGSLGCGLCISLHGTGAGSGANPISKTPVTVFVADSCPTCSTGDIDLAASGDGKWNINWIAVPCPIGNNNLQYKLQGSNVYYLKVQVVGHKWPISSLAFVIGGKTYQGVRTSDNYFTSPSNAPTPFSFPLKVQVTADNGQTVTDTIPSLTNNVLLTGGIGAQFTGTTLITNDNQAASSSDSGLYIGIGVGCALVALLIVVLVVVVIRRNKIEHEYV